MLVTPAVAHYADRTHRQNRCERLRRRAVQPLGDDLLEENLVRIAEQRELLAFVRTLEQLKDNLGVLANLELSPEDLAAIDEATKGAQLDNYPLKR